MSTIDSGVLGIVQGQAPAKGKAGHGKEAGIAEKGDFATAIASLQGKEGGEGRKGGRISISASANAKETGEAKEGQKTPALDDMPALAEAFSRAAKGASGDEKPASHEKAAGHAEKHKRAAGKADASAEDDAGDTKAAPVAQTDVGNLLELLGAPGAMPQIIGGAAVKAAAHGVAEIKAQAGDKSPAKAGKDVDAKAQAVHSDDAADDAEMPETNTDRLFRFARADGKGRDLDVSISGNGERRAFRDANAAGAKAEAVTVVDARRYIGLAQAGNAAAVTAAITQDPQWAASLSATGGLSHMDEAATGKVVNTLKIQMHPIELGLVTATLHLQGEELVVSLQVETGDAYRKLSDDQDSIVRALRGHGFAVDQVSVQLAPSDRSAQSGNQGQQQQQFSGQPQAQAGGNGRQGGEGASAREERSYEGTTSENAPAASGSQPVRSGGVYL